MTVLQNFVAKIAEETIVRILKRIRQSFMRLNYFLQKENAIGEPFQSFRKFYKIISYRFCPVSFLELIV